MNKEQKQAIKELKHFNNMTVFWKEKEYTSHEIDNCINIVLHLIDKQQKEIEELKEKNKILEELLQGRLFELYNYYKELAGKYQGNCISKDKIREIIGKYVDIEEHLVYHHQELWGADLAEMIKELLGE